jgi:hypothetical protein
MFSVKGKQMSAIEVTESDELIRAAYWQAWKEYQDLPQTPDERRYGPQRLQNEIRALVEHGERNVETIAIQALGNLRQSEQIERSRARVMSESYVVASAN